MAAEQSQFSRLPKKQLVLIAEKLVDESFPSGNPYNDREYEEHYNNLSSIGKYFNINVNEDDVQFFAKFLEINDDLIADIFANNSQEINNRELIEQLVIPVAKTYDLRYNVWGTCTYDEYLAQYFDAYDKDWVADSAKQQREDGNWDLYDGRNIRETTYDNFDESDYSFDDVYEVNDDKTYKIKESLLNRLVLENTSEVVSSLDKQTLLKLKQIIESRLRSL
jgi:hypothetical protein